MNIVAWEWNRTGTLLVADLLGLRVRERARRGRKSKKPVARGTSVRKLVIVAFLVAILPASAMAQSWTYVYDSGTDMGIWSWGSAQRFSYDYTHLQWWDTSNFGGRQTLGDAGFSPATRGNGANDPNFLGNGSWHTVGTGLSFMYVQGADSNRWKVNGNYRFSYGYAWGLWYDFYAGTNTWSLMGSGLSSDFLGDGDWHTMKTGVSYMYLAGGDSSRWRVNGNYRFAYLYKWGLWYDYFAGTNTWSALGSSGLPSDFLGDGYWHTVGTGLSYQYLQGGDSSRWKVNGTYRFAYLYSYGLWYDYSSGTNTWSTLASSGLCSLFIGDGNVHDLLDGFSYLYDKDLALGYWLVGGANRFRYDYSYGNWYHYGPIGGAFQLATSVSAQFLGDYAKASPLYTLYGCYYWYDTSSGIGNLSMTSGANPRFHYVYSNGQWFHYGPVDSVGQALSAPNRSARLIVSYNSSSDSLDLGTGFNYWYNGAAGIWAVGANDRFAYSYWVGQWSFLQAVPVPAWNALGTTDVSAAFIGDGSEHTLGSGYYWNVHYDGSVLNFNIWTNLDTAERNYLRYNFTAEVWQDRNSSAGYGWRDLVGYYLDSEGQNGLSLRKSDYSFVMDLMFGTSHYEGQEIVALYRQNGVVPVWYHDYVNAEWYRNLAGINPIWDGPYPGATDEYRP